MKKFLLLAVFVLCAFAAHAEAPSPYKFTEAVIRETPAKIAAGYVTIENTSDENDALISAQASWATRIELHMVKESDDGIMQMASVKQIPLMKKSSLSLKQGGYHLMIFGVKEELKLEDKKEITLRFAKAGTIIVPFTIEPIGKGTQAKMMHDHLMMMGHDKNM